MVNITLSVSEKLYKRMKSHSQLKWSEFVRQSIEQKLKDIEEAPWREYALRKIAQGDEAHELFDF